MKERTPEKNVINRQYSWATLWKACCVLISLRQMSPLPWNDLLFFNKRKHNILGLGRRKHTFINIKEMLYFPGHFVLWKETLEKKGSLWSENILILSVKLLPDLFCITSLTSSALRLDDPEISNQSLFYCSSAIITRAN